jgi:regulator of sigma E protease
VLTFGVAIFVHELGHFLAARLRGVGVEAFAIGMGPKIIAWRHGGTEFSLRWLPVGGFVKLHQMVREEAEEKPPACRPDRRRWTLHRRGRP